MLKKRHLIVLLIVALVAVLALSACGGDDDKDEKKATSTPVATAEATAEATPEATEEVMATAEATEEATPEATEEVMATAEATEEVMATAEPTEEAAMATAEPTEEAAMATAEATEEVAMATEEVAMATEATEEAAMATAEAGPMDVLGVATADGRFSMLLAVVDMAGLSDQLTGEGPITVFAPTDEGLGALLAEQPDMTNSMMADEAMLSGLLLYHVVPGKVTVADLAEMDSITTLEGEDIAISTDADGNVMLNGTIKIVDADIEGGNGLIQVIDGALIPPSVIEAMAAQVTPEPTEEVAMVAEATEEAMAPEATEEPAMPAASLIDCDAYDLSDMKIGLVTDVGQINDKSFNQSSWEGVLAAEQCGASVNYIETQDAADYADNIAEFAENEYDVIVTVGFALGTATTEAATTYPDVMFIGVDQGQSEVLDNVVGLIFHEDQSGYLAGVLAARLTQTGTIAAVLGTDQVPPVVAFKEGYEAGAKAINPDITIISSYHPGSIDQAFTDPEWGATTAKQALDQNADVVFAAGGKTGNGGLIEVANAVGEAGPPPFCIGVDTDQWETVPEAHPCLVSSAMKLLDQGVADIIMSISDETVEAGNHYGAAALAPFHDLADAVPDDVKAELEEIAAGLFDGSITTGYGTATAEEPAMEATEEPAMMATEEVMEATEEPAAEPTEEVMEATEEAMAAEATEAPAMEATEEASEMVGMQGELGVIKVGTNAEYPPFESVDENGNVIGFDVDLLNAIAAQAGFEIEWVNTRWDGIFVALQSGEFDAVASAATITEEREEIIDFSRPYFNAGQMIAVPVDNPNNVQTPADLAGLRVGVQSGTTGDLAASDIAGVEVVRYDEITLAFQALASGDVDAIVNDGPVSADIISKNPDMNVKLIGDPFTDEFYGIAVQPDEPELLDAINGALDALVADGTYNDLYNTWFGTDAPSMFRPHEETMATGADLGVVTVGTNAEYPPFEFVDENGNVTGFDVDLLTAIAANAGFELNWVNTRWDGIFVALQSGEFDAVASAATITEEREQIVDFSKPYFNAGQMIAVRSADASTIKTPDDLAGLRVGVQSGTTGDLAASEMPGVEVVRYDEITLAFQALGTGDVDAIVNDGPVSADIISKNPDLGAVLVGDPFTDEFYGIAVQPDKPELLDAVNAGLDAIVADGTYNDLYLKWFGIEAPSMFKPAE